MNFGAFASPERKLVFGINDFDETLPGPWEWDVKRLAASFAIAGRDNGFAVKERKKVLLTLLGAYRETMRKFAGMTNMSVWYSHLDVDELLRHVRHHVDAATRKRAQANVARARTRDSLQAFDKLTHVVDGQRRIISDPPLIQPVEELFEEADRQEFMEVMRSWCAVTGARSRATAGTCSRTFASPTWPARSSAWAASAHVHGSC